MLEDKIFCYSYSQIDEHLPIEFFLQAFSNSTHLDLGLGYFSSACFHVLANGIAHFIVNGGNMNLYINQYVSQEDFNLLKGDYDGNVDTELIKSFNLIRNTFEERDEHFFQCLAYLIKTSRINIKIVVLCNGALPHEKYGIFTDEVGNKIYFTGSMNMTASALTQNLETIQCTCSWMGDDSKERVKNFEQHFNKVWREKCPGIEVYEAKKFCNEILRTYPNQNMDLLVLREREVIKKMQLRRQAVCKNNPHFPQKYSEGARPYQEDAYMAWIKNGKKGIFAMATGTGKTVTSLNCVLHEFVNDEFYQLMILAPTLDLIEQWKEELLAFNFTEILCVSSLNPLWKSKLYELSRKIKRGIKVNFAIVSTYDSFVNKDFQNILPALSATMILIADEAHNIGGTKVKKCFQNLLIRRRIALSATPERIYDEEGSSEISKFFDDDRPYIYSFPMSKAIAEGRLCRYFYYPKVAYLNEDEMRLYSDISMKLSKLWDTSKGSYKNKEAAEILLMNRKRIVHKCADKIRVFREILQEIGEENLKYTFVYAPQGKYEVMYENTSSLLSDRDEVSFIQKLLDTIKEIFPMKLCNAVIGVDSKEKRTTILEAFSQGKLDVLFAMKCLDEGIDIPRAERGIFTSSTGNPREYIQRRGRLLRNHPDKKYSYIYDIIVIPKPSCHLEGYTRIEQNQVKSELRRVAYFASLAENYYTSGGAYEILRDVFHHYGISMSELIKEIENQQ